MFAAIPALLGSLVLMNVAGAPRALWAQQAIVAATATVTVFFAARHSKAKSAVIRAPWLLLGMAALVCAPLLGVGSPAPRRWLEFSGIRLYVASAVLPVFLLVWHRGLAGGRATAVMSSVAVAFTALALFLQPDAAQLTALAIASLPILWSCSGGRLVARSTLAALSLLLAAAVSWRTPDPLAPVPYVEGVFVSAAGYSDWALVAAVLAAALPVTALGWSARRTKSRGIFAVTFYYAVLYLLAPAQVTPVPLLGFGAGPILGYFVMAYFVTALLRHGPCRTGLPGLVLAARSTPSPAERLQPVPGDNSATQERSTGGMRMPPHRIFGMPFARVYPAYVQKAERKNRTKKEVDQIICWLTGYDQAGLRKQIKDEVDFETFFAQAPALHPNTALIKGVVCGVRVEEVDDPLMQKIRWLDKLIDELAKGKAMDKILRQ